MRYGIVIGSFVIFGILARCAPRQARNFDPSPTTILLALSDSIFTESILVVKTCVNWKGEVISTEFQENQSTTSDTTLINKAIRAAKVYKFEERQGSPIQCGNMTFKFKLKNK